MEITGQLSYPLNSENARPFGTLRAYLSCVEMAVPACDWTAVGAAAAPRRGRLWMKRTSFQVSLSEVVDFQEGMPVRRTPFCMIQNSSASVQCCTWGELRSMAGGFMLRPMLVSPRASAPWHWAQDPRNTSCPWVRTSADTGSGFFIFPASSGMVTSLAALARLVSPWEGALSAVQPASKAPSIAMITPSISLCSKAALILFSSRIWLSCVTVFSPFAKLPVARMRFVPDGSHLCDHSRRTKRNLLNLSID